MGHTSGATHWVTFIPSPGQTSREHILVFGVVLWFSFICSCSYFERNPGKVLRQVSTLCRCCWQGESHKVCLVHSEGHIPLTQTFMQTPASYRVTVTFSHSLKFPLFFCTTPGWISRQNHVFVLKGVSHQDQMLWWSPQLHHNRCQLWFVWSRTSMQCSAHWSDAAAACRIFGGLSILRQVLDLETTFVGNLRQKMGLFCLAQGVSGPI